VEPTSDIRAGGPASFRVDTEQLHLFDTATSAAIGVHASRLSSGGRRALSSK